MICSYLSVVGLSNFFSPTALDPALFEIRVIRMLIALISGGTLAISGVVFQSVFRNPMAEPYLLGASSGAFFFVALLYFLSTHFQFQAYGYVPAAGFTGACLAVFLTFILARKNGRFPVYRLLLTGIAVAFFFGSFSPILLAFSGRDLYTVFFFMNGSTQGRSLAELIFECVLLLPGTLTIIGLSKYIDYALLGEERSFHVGVDFEKIKIILLLAASYLAGITVSFSGVIGFVGLVIPNIFRKKLAVSPLAWILASGIGGATFLILCDLISRSVFYPREVPLTSITALLGAPYLIATLRKNGD